MPEVVRLGGAVDEDVIKKDKHEPVEEGMQDVVLEGLESGRGVAQPKGITRNS